MARLDATSTSARRAAGGQIRLGGQLVDYALNRRRRRSIGFVVGPQGLTINAPASLRRDEIDAALQAKSNWILAKLTEQRERALRQLDARIEWRDGCMVPFLGRDVVVAVADRQGIVEADAVLRIGLALPIDAPPERIEAAVQRRLQAEARRLYAERCAHYGSLLGVRPKALRLSSARTRWGSCSADGSIRLNWRLIHLSLASIDYVVVHELAHLREMNHGPRFWAIVAGVLPDYEARRLELRGVLLPSMG